LSSVSRLDFRAGGNDDFTLSLPLDGGRVLLSSDGLGGLLEEPPLFYQPVRERGVGLYASNVVAVRPDYR